MPKHLSINIRGKLIGFDTPRVMGILNSTPDSFYSGSRSTTEQEVLRTARRMINQGADIIDVGACSTRPGSVSVSEDEEMRRLEIALSVIRKRWPNMLLSVDTFRSGVARRCVKDWEVYVINDISGGTLDKRMYETVAELQVVYILMHTRGTPETMHQFANYTDITAELLSDLAFKLARLDSMGVRDIVIDPGFGFAKNQDHNYILLNELDQLKNLGRPVMVGVSRKSMVYEIINSTPDKALNGTSVVNTIALLNGADILRVHDVAEAKQAINLVSKLFMHRQ